VGTPLFWFDARSDTLAFWFSEQVRACPRVGVRVRVRVWVRVRAKVRARVRVRVRVRARGLSELERQGHCLCLRT